MKSDIAGPRNGKGLPLHFFGWYVVFWRELTRPRWPFAPPRHPRKFTRAAPPADSSARGAGKMPALQKTGAARHARRVHPERAYIYYSARVKRLSVRANCERSLSPVRRSGRPSWPDGRFIASVNQPALAFAGVIS